jgi:hypothetical protein
VSKAAHRDGSRPLPLLDVDRLGHRRSFPVSLLMLGPGRLQLPYNAMTKLGQDVVHFSHHSPSPFFIYERGERVPRADAVLTASWRPGVLSSHQLLDARLAAFLEQ